jgi:hypothetical protein
MNRSAVAEIGKFKHRLRSLDNHACRLPGRIALGSFSHYGVLGPPYWAFAYPLPPWLGNTTWTQLLHDVPHFREEMAAAAGSEAAMVATGSVAAMTAPARTTRGGGADHTWGPWCAPHCSRVEPATHGWSRGAVPRTSRAHRSARGAPSRRPAAVRGDPTLVVAGSGFWDIAGLWQHRGNFSRGWSADASHAAE